MAVPEPRGGCFYWRREHVHPPLDVLEEPQEKSIPGEESTTVAQSFLPVDGVLVQGRVTDLVAELSLVQSFHNREGQPIEVSFVFPVDRTSAVSSFSVEVGGRVLKGAVEEKERAAEVYEDALASGHKAFLFEKKDEFSYTVNIGRLDVDEQVNISVSFVKELVADSSTSTLSLIIPKGLLPPLSGGGSAAEGPAAGEQATAFGPVPVGDVRVHIEADMPSPIRSVAVANHSPDTTVDANKAVIELAGLQQGMAADLVLHFQVEKLPLPIVSVERDPDNSNPEHEFCACVSLIPGTDANLMAEINTELLFVMDCSGSMAGGRIRESKRAMQIFLQSLEEGVHFNILRFGSTFEMLWPDSMPVTEANLQAAKAYVDRADADLGGTELRPVLQMIYRKEHMQGKSRQMFLLTDGEVRNTRECIAEVSNNASNTRVFAIGLGNEVDAELVLEMARKGNGQCSFVSSGEQELLTRTVVAQLGYAMKPALTDCRIEIRECADPAGVTLCRDGVPPTFVGDAQNAFAFFKGSAAPFEIFLSAKCGGEEIEEFVTVDPQFHRVGRMIHVMGAKQRISDLEDRSVPNSREEIVRLAVQYNLSSKSTSFVVVDDSPQEAQAGAPELRKVDISLQMGYNAKPPPDVEPAEPEPVEEPIDWRDMMGGLDEDAIDADFLADLKAQAEAMGQMQQQQEQERRRARAAAEEDRPMESYFRGFGAPMRASAAAPQGGRGLNMLESMAASLGSRRQSLAGGRNRRRKAKESQGFGHERALLMDMEEGCQASSDSDASSEDEDEFFYARPAAAAKIVERQEKRVEEGERSQMAEAHDELFDGMGGGGGYGGLHHPHPHPHPQVQQSFGFAAGAAAAAPPPPAPAPTGPGAVTAPEQGQAPRADGTLESVLLCQKVSGAWVDASVLAAVLNVPAEEVEAKGEGISEDPTVWLSAVALAILEVVFPDHRPEWELIFGKGQRFVGRKLAAEDTQSCLKRARDFVSGIHGASSSSASS